MDRTRANTVFHDPDRTDLPQVGLVGLRAAAESSAWMFGTVLWG